MQKKFRKEISRIITILALLAVVLPLYADSYYDRRVSQFELLNIDNNDIVFLGNSITDGGELSELLGMDNVKNRGISSDVISGVEKRLEQVTKGKPKKIFLLIGINDVSHKLTSNDIAVRYERLVDKIRKQSPESKLYIQSIMPINNDFKRYKSLYGTENVILETNLLLKAIAEKHDAVYIDLFPALADKSTGKLKRIYTNDGLHLTGEGYKAWMDAIKPYINNKIIN